MPPSCQMRQFGEETSETVELPRPAPPNSATQPTPKPNPTRPEQIKDESVVFHRDFAECSPARPNKQKNVGWVPGLPNPLVPNVGLPKPWPPAPNSACCASTPCQLNYGPNSRQGLFLPEQSPTRSVAAIRCRLRTSTHLAITQPVFRNIKLAMAIQRTLRPVLRSCSAALLVSAAMCTSESAIAAEPTAPAEPTASVEVELGQADLTSGIPGFGLLSEAQIDAWLSDPSNHAPLTVKLPPGLDAGSANIFIPKDNPMTKAKVELGRQLYFDERLSSDNTISCASCHDPAQGWGAETKFGIGVVGQQGGRNSPVSYNRILSKAQFWDGRAATLEEQAVGPIANPIEMGNTHEASLVTIKKIPGYVKQFEKIFADGIMIDNVGKAIATFERAIVTGPMPYDSYAALASFEKTFADDLEYLDEEPELKEKYDALKAATQKTPMSESAQRGMVLFSGKANCAACHAGANFTDEQYHNLGVGMDAETPDLGRSEISGDKKDTGAFKTPTLRNVVFSPPYMHDGSQSSLEEVIDWYDKGGHKNEFLSDKMKVLKLTDQEKADLLAFMIEGLTGEFTPVVQGRLPN